MIHARVGDKKQTKRRNIAEILFWQGVMYQSIPAVPIPPGQPWGIRQFGKIIG